MLFGAICVAAMYLSILSMCLGWMIGARMGDETGLIGWALGGLALGAGILFGLATT